MKTTLDLPDELMREVKILAVQTDRRLKDTIADLLRKGLDQPEAKPETDQIRNRVKLPIFSGGHPAAPGEEMTPERLHEILLEQDVDRALGR
ncbi:MAG: antitoxin [Thermomicrobiales bacterium]